MKYLIIADKPKDIRDLSVVLCDIDTDAVIDTALNSDNAFELCKKDTYDVIFLEIAMSDGKGLNLAEKLKELMPLVNMVIVTEGKDYAYDALRLYVSAYILKPVTIKDVREALSNLRNLIASEQKGLSARCFGDFEIFFNGHPVRFRRTKTKEMLAYLIDRRGSVVSGAQLRAVLWEDEQEDTERLSNYFSQLTRDIKATLEEVGCPEAIAVKRNAYAVVPDKISCDLYRALEKDPKFMDGYKGEYMSQYSWSEFR